MRKRTEAGLETRSEYWDDREAREAFKEFILEIHRLDFEQWESAGYWDHAYTPFSFFQDGKVIATVCIYLLEAVVHGEATRMVQISGVGTRPGWRRQGLNRELTQMGLRWAQDRSNGVFLFADPGAIPYYERCGFSALAEFAEFTDARPVQQRKGAVKIDPGTQSARDRIYEYARQRTPVSDRFFVGNARLLMFHALYDLQDHIYEIPDLDCLVFFARDEGCLRLYDVVGERVPSLEELYPYLADPSDETIEFHFHADKLGVDGVQRRPLLGNDPFTRGQFPVENPVFPYMSRA